MNIASIKIVLIFVIIILIAFFGYYLYWKSSINGARELYEEGRWEEAEKKILSNLKRFPSIFPERDRSYLMLGEINYNKGDAVTAEKYFHSAIQNNETQALPYYRIGIIREREGHYEDAIDYLEKAYSFSNKKSDFHHDLKSRLSSMLFRYGMQCYHTRRYEKAEKYFSEALEYSPNFPEALHALGKIYYRKREYKKAWYNYKKAIELNGDLVVLYEDVNIVLVKLKRHEEAKRYKKIYDDLMSDKDILEEEQTLDKD